MEPNDKQNGGVKGIIHPWDAKDAAEASQVKCAEVVFVVVVCAPVHHVSLVYSRMLKTYAE